MKTTNKRLQNLYEQRELNQEEVSMREGIVGKLDKAADKAYQAVERAQKWVTGFGVGFAINAFGFVSHHEWLEQTGQYLGLFETDVSKGFGIGMLVTGVAAGLAILNQNRKEAKFERTVDRYDRAVDRLNDTIAEGDAIEEDIVRTENFERATRYGTELYEQARQEKLMGVTAGAEAELSAMDAQIKVLKPAKPEEVVDATVTGVGADNGVSFDPTN